MRPLQHFQLARLQHALAQRENVAGQWHHRLLDHGVYSLYQSCEHAGVAVEARALIERYRSHRKPALPAPWLEQMGQI